MVIFHGYVSLPEGNYIDNLEVYGCLWMFMHAKLVEIVYIWIVSKVRISKPTYQGPRAGSWERIIFTPQWTV